MNVENIGLKRVNVKVNFVPAVIAATLVERQLATAYSESGGKPPH